jgi:hypothetical protein
MDSGSSSCRRHHVPAIRRSSYFTQTRFWHSSHWAITLRS